VGVFVFRMRWFEFCIVFSMVVPLWSGFGECQRVEWALTSPVRTELGRDRLSDRKEVIAVSSVWLLLFVSLGGKYRFVM